VPRRVGQQQAICLDISYMGLMDLAMATGSIKWAQAELVRANDGFARGRFDEPPKHEFNPFSKDRGEIIGVYVVVKTADGDYLTHTMEIGEVYDIRDRSEAWKSYVAKKIKSCPWVSDTGEMIKKTCVKQAYKYWPKTERLENAIHHLNTDGGEGLTDINARPAGAVDVEPMIAAALRTKTDADALKFWRDNNAALVGQPQGHKRLKDVIAGHRAKMLADAARTVEMEQPETPPMTDAEIEAADLAREVAA
jgi:recombination protein RecT